MSTTLVSFGFISANASAWLLEDELKHRMETRLTNSGTGTTTVPPLPAAPSALVRNDRILNEAYYDTYRILSGDNACSQFFGGSPKATVVLSSLMGSVQKEYLEGSVGMRMSGEITTVNDAPTQTKYRLFKNVAINAKGPFYRKRSSSTEMTIPRLGSYEPNTKAIRAFILLHELGHLMKGDDGNWLLPDDGKSEALSRDNSAKIENVCGDQIKNLSRSN
ncbi:MAG TPA: hypothetical protein VJU86_02495 [Pyrinomonadaceae bacterium]|nr:hypothetical protein [Pyrinomonadaceae bacterium]